MPPPRQLFARVSSDSWAQLGSDVKQSFGCVVLPELRPPLQETLGHLTAFQSAEAQRIWKKRVSESCPSQFGCCHPQALLERELIAAKDGVKELLHAAVVRFGQLLDLCHPCRLASVPRDLEPPNEVEPEWSTLPGVPPPAFRVSACGIGPALAARPPLSPASPYLTQYSICTLAIWSPPTAQSTAQRASSCWLRMGVDECTICSRGHGNPISNLKLHPFIHSAPQMARAAVQLRGAPGP